MTSKNKNKREKKQHLTCCSNFKKSNEKQRSLTGQSVCIASPTGNATFFQLISFAASFIYVMHFIAWKQ